MFDFISTFKLWFNDLTLINVRIFLSRLNDFFNLRNQGWDNMKGCKT